MNSIETIRILYVEDNKKHVEEVIKMLNESQCIKFDIEHRGDLHSSIEYLNSIDCNVDAILLDLMLPNSEGVETFKKVYNTCDVPIVIISVHEEIAFKCVSLGAQDYLVKPNISGGLISRSIRFAIERKKLQIQEKKYKLLVEATNAGIYEIDFINDKFTYVNDVMCKLTGWSREELMNMGPSHLLTEKSLNDWIKRWDALNHGEYIDKTFEYEAKIKDGSTIWTLVTAEFKEDEIGKIVGARVIAINITNSKLAEEEAKKREEVIFNELEDRIHKWRQEISLKTAAHENKLREITLNINSMNTLEVY
jgi:PAS domain S-box-containing protein